MLSKLCVLLHRSECGHIAKAVAVKTKSGIRSSIFNICLILWHESCKAKNLKCHHISGSSTKIRIPSCRRLNFTTELISAFQGLTSRTHLKGSNLLLLDVALKLCNFLFHGFLCFQIEKLIQSPSIQAKKN